MALFGRERELDLIAEVLDGVGEGPGALLVTGEAGIGKSALLAAVVDAARGRGMQTAAGRAAEHEGSLPFALIADALDPAATAMHASRLAAVGPGLAGVLPAAGEAPPGAGPAQRAVQHRGVATLVGLLARERPLALVLDDLHWADEASLETVLHLLRRPPDDPVVLVLALRPGERVAPLLDAARAGGEHRHLALGPLDAASSWALARAEGAADERVTVRIVAEAAGNPLFTRALARAAGSGEPGLPATLVAAVQQETAALDEEARTLLWGAVVAGDPFDLPLAAAAADLPVDRAGPALDRVVAAGLVAPDPAGRTFVPRHPLVRRAVYDELPPAWRLAAHERAARALAERGAPAALRAYHVERFAHPPDESAAGLLEAAAVEVVASSPATAARWLDAAAALLPTARTSLLVPLARARASAGRPEEALAAYEAALADPGVPDRVRLAVEAAGLERLLGRNVDALRRLEGLAAAPSGPDGVALEAALAASCFVLGDLDGTAAHARRVAEHQAGDEPAVEAIILGTEGFVRTYAGEDAAHLLDRAERAALALPDDVALEAVGWVGQLSFQCERYAPAAELLARAVTRAERVRQEHVLLQLRTVSAIAGFFDLRLTEALGQLELAEDAARLYGVPLQLGIATSTGAIVLDVLGRGGEAARLAQESLDRFAGLEPSVFTRIGAALSLTVLHEHDPERLLATVLDVLGDELELLERPTTLLAPLVRAALATGRRSEAETWVTRVAAAAAERGLPAAGVRADGARALLELDAGDAPAAAERLGRAVERADAHVLRQDAVRSRILAGRALAEAGERGRAAPVLEEALVQARRAGAERLAAEAARELRRAGLRVSAGARRAAGGDEDLTERERAIAELVAAGRANKEVAAALHLSVKTVENNLSRIYAKLGVRSRTELARTLAEPGE